MALIQTVKSSKMKLPVANSGSLYKTPEDIPPGMRYISFEITTVKRCKC